MIKKSADIVRLQRQIVFRMCPIPPYIGYLFVGEEYRGNRLSQKLIRYAMDYLKSIGFDRVHIVSDHENLYEKYGFEIVDRKTAPWGSMEKIYMKRLT